jgi:hypothetical protein
MPGVANWEIGENNTGNAEVQLDEGDYAMKFSIDAALKRYYFVYFSTVPGQHDVKDGEVRVDMKQVGGVP